MAEKIGIAFMTDAGSFIKDSLFGKFGCIINLDSGKLEMWKGFQHKPQAGNRYGCEAYVCGCGDELDDNDPEDAAVLDETMESGAGGLYFPCAMVGPWDLGVIFADGADAYLQEMLALDTAQSIRHRRGPGHYSWSLPFAGLKRSRYSCFATSIIARHDGAAGSGHSRGSFSTAARALCRAISEPAKRPVMGGQDSGRRGQGKWENQSGRKDYTCDIRHDCDGDAFLRRLQKRK